MKLPLFHHGYQGKHERGQVIPRQRDREPELGTVEELETGEDQETARPGGDGSRAVDRTAAPRPPAPALAVDSNVGAAAKNGHNGTAPEGSGETGRV